MPTARTHRISGGGLKAAFSEGNRKSKFKNRKSLPGVHAATVISPPERWALTGLQAGPLWPRGLNQAAISHTRVP